MGTRSFLNQSEKKGGIPFHCRVGPLGSPYTGRVPTFVLPFQTERSRREQVVPRPEPPQKHWFGPSSKKAKGKGHPVLFGFRPAEDFGDMPDGGGYPLRFLNRAYELLGVEDPDQVLHLCSGSMRRGIRVDIRPEMKPDVVCDCRATPFADQSFRWIMADPPYSEEYAHNLYGTGDNYPKPGQILREAARLLQPGGRIGLLHFQVPIFHEPLKLVGVWGITTGCGYAIRAFSVLERQGKK